MGPRKEKSVHVSGDEPGSSKEMKRSGSAKVTSKDVKKPKTQLQREEEERKLRKKIMSHLQKIENYQRMTKKLTQEVDEMKDEYLKTFNKEFEETDEEFDYTTISATYNKREQHQNEKTKFPVNGKFCYVCQSKSTMKFSTDEHVNLCGQCLASVASNNLLPGEEVTVKTHIFKYREIQCVCPKQLAGLCRPDWRIYDCMRCKLGTIKDYYPDVYTSDNLIPAVPPTFTKPGHFGHLMNLSTVKRENYTNKPPAGVNTVALLVTVMDLIKKDDRVVNNIQNKGERVLGCLLLKVEFDDPRLDSALDIKQIASKNAVDKGSLGRADRYIKVDADLVHVDLKLIEWSPQNSTKAAVAINSTKMIHYLVNPMLNSKQKLQTRLGSMELQSKYLNLDGINYFIKQRKIDLVGWRENQSSVINLVGPKTATSGRCKKSTVTDTKSSEEKYVANIYAYFVKIKEIVWVNVGSHCGSRPRVNTAHKGTALAKLLSANPDAPWFSTVLVHLKNNNNDHKLLYEGQVQTIFKFAELNKMTLDQMTLPFLDSGGVFMWTDLDQNKLPKLKFQLLNERIHGYPMNQNEFQFFLNLPRLFFGREFAYPDLYKWEFDPLRFTIEPSDDRSMEVEQETREDT